MFRHREPRFAQTLLRRQVALLLYVRVRVMCIEGYAQTFDVCFQIFGCHPLRSTPRGETTAIKSATAQEMETISGADSTWTLTSCA